MIWMVPLAACLCAAGIQAMRRNWKTSLIWLLASSLFLQWMAFSGQIHTHRATLIALRTHVLKLEKESEMMKEWMKIEMEKELPNQASTPIGANAPQPQR
jgi:hypothetical protein